MNISATLRWACSIVLKSVWVPSYWLKWASTRKIIGWSIVWPDFCLAAQPYLTVLFLDSMSPLVADSLTTVRKKLSVFCYHLQPIVLDCIQFQEWTGKSTKIRTDGSAVVICGQGPLRPSQPPFWWSLVGELSVSMKWHLLHVLQLLWRNPNGQE